MAGTKKRAGDPERKKHAPKTPAGLARSIAAGSANLRPWQPGQSGNPGGYSSDMARAAADLTARLGKYDQELEDFFVGVLRDTDAELADRFRAADWITVRRYGQPTSRVEAKSEASLTITHRGEPVPIEVAEEYVRQVAEAERRLTARLLPAETETSSPLDRDSGDDGE